MMNTKLLEKSVIAESSSYIAVKQNDVVKLRIGNEPPASDTPISVPNLLHRTVLLHGDCNALAYSNKSKQWEYVTYKEYQKKILNFAKIFIKLGLMSRDVVGILSKNCPEWFYTEMAVIHAGGIVSGIYMTSSSDAIHHIIQSSNTKIVVVGDDRQMKKIQSIKNRLPNLKIVIQIDDSPFIGNYDDEIEYYKWSDIENIDVSDMNDELEERLSKIVVNECCCLIYTSGTVGFPKAVMISHDGLIWNSSRVADEAPKTKQMSGKHIFISYLPLNHMAAQIYEIILPIIEGGCVYFADKDALKATLINTMQIARPTRFLGVPRVWEKINEHLVLVEKNSSKIYKFIFGWAKNVVLNHNKKIIKDGSCFCWQYWFAKNLVRSMQAVFGLDRCEWCITGAAPTNPETKEYFMSLDIKLLEVYGMSETSGAISLMGDVMPNYETSGKILPGFQVKIDNADEKGHGEICIKTRTTFMGYLNQLEKTNEIIDKDDWLHSGDVGYIDEHEYLYITGRLKELIITSGGENIPPVHIENLVKRELSCISNAFLVGDRRKFLSMLLTIKTEMDPDTGAPRDELHSDSITWMESLNVSHKTITDILNAGPCPKVMESIQQGIDRANQNAISNAQKIQKFTILPHDFSIPTNELGPTLKLKRNVILNKYKNIIDKFYE